MKSVEFYLGYCRLVNDSVVENITKDTQTIRSKDFMKILTVFTLLLLGYSMIVAQSKTNALIIAETEPPIVPDKISGGQFQGLTEDLYNKFPAEMWKDPNYVRIKRKPKRLSADARFGINILINRKNVGWIIDGDQSRGLVLYADWNADSDLSNDAPIKFTKTGDKYIYRKTLVETIGNQKRKYPYNLKLEITEVDLPNGMGKTLALKADSATARRGVLNVDNRRIAFSLTGRDGFYNTDYDYLYFDLNGDGKFDTETRYSAESYKVLEKHVNIGDKTYEFTVDRYGDSLTLKPLTEKLPARAELSVGNPAPEFAFKDIDGNSHRLSDFRGRIVLLDFGEFGARRALSKPRN